MFRDIPVVIRAEQMAEAENFNSERKIAAAAATWGAACDVPLWTLKLT